MHHETINESLTVYGNNDLWTTEEKADINRAVEIYLSKKKRRSRSSKPKIAKMQKMDDAVSTIDLTQSSCNDHLSDSSVAASLSEVSSCSSENSD